MKLNTSSVAILVAAVLSVALRAESGATMAGGDKMSKMANKMEMKDSKYVGCIEAGGAAGTFTLTHLTAEDHMRKDTMKDTMKSDAMAPAMLSLTGSSVDLSKHLGHKVSVTGSLAHEQMAFTVKSLKLVSATCS